MPSIEMTVTIQATPQTVWRMLTEPGQLQRWFPSAVENDLTIGGGYTYRFEKAPPEERVDIVRGEYREIEPYRKLVHSWAFETGERAVESTVEWTLEPDGDSTVLTLHHHGFEDSDTGRKEQEMHRQGWEWYLGNLKGLHEGAQDVRPAANMVVASTS